MLVQVRAARAGQALEEERGTGVGVSDGELDGAEVLEGVDPHLRATGGVGELVDQLEGALPPLPGAREIACEHAQLGAVAVGESQLDGARCRRRGLQDLDGGAGLVLGGVVASGEPAQAREAPPGVAHTHRLAARLPDRTSLQTVSIASSMRSVRYSS